ncbi:MAG: GAF domain-containing protein [Bacteroidales bacterium]|nr:GAF domain-containing protein [Bacteroidales bacterium]
MEKEKKAGRYARVLEQLETLLLKSNNTVSDMATIAALLHHKMDDFFWTGFYLLHDGQLQVGPYQGSLACIDLKKDTGVCWAGVNRRETVVVPDVHTFPGHIACDGRSNAEIVVPLFGKTGEVFAVLDVDSTRKNAFDEVDAVWLGKIVSLVQQPQ